MKNSGGTCELHSKTPKGGAQSGGKGREEWRGRGEGPLKYPPCIPRGMGGMACIARPPKTTTIQFLSSFSTSLAKFGMGTKAWI